MNNIINAIINLVNSPKIDLNYQTYSNNRANSMGECLEEYIKDLFAGTVNINDPIIRNEMLSHTFSYLGNQNNPPDIMLLNGDAIEVKKIESKSAALALTGYNELLRLVRYNRQGEGYNETEKPKKYAKFHYI